MAHTITTCVIILLCVGIGNAILVNTSSGRVMGHTITALDIKINEFLNIPYAEPPIGKLRFAPPLPLKTPKHVIIDGTKPGNYCIQSAIGFGGIKTFVPQSEDCLVLNIWTPNVNNNTAKQSKGTLKAVMYSLYSGGLSIGSIFQDFYNGDVLATNDVVVVSANYRVGPLGFLYGSDDTAPGNVGFYDQLLGLKWVRQNIHQFGGDKDKITIFGFSAGSWSVSAHILSPLSKGMFKRGVMSGGALMFNRDRPVLNTTEALQKAKQLAKRLNCTQSDNKWSLNCNERDNKWLDCLRTIKDPNVFIERSNSTMVVTHPVFGTKFLPLIPQKAFKTGQYNSDVEILAGTAKNEGSVLSRWVIPELKYAITERQFRAFVNVVNNEFHNIDVDKVSEYYLRGVHKSDSTQLKSAFEALFGDLVMTCPTYLFAKQIALNGAKSVYLYRSNYVVKFFKYIQQCGDQICHGADLILIYGFPLRYPRFVTQSELSFATDVIKLITNFAKTGKPHEDWPQVWDKSVIRVKDLSPNDMTLILENPYERTCDGIWKQYF